MRIDQVIPTLADRDAIGMHTVALRDALRRAGIASDIFYGACTPAVTGEGRPVTELGPPDPDRRLLYQLSIGSPVFDTVIDRPEPLLVNYHNITPAALLQQWEPAVGAEVALGRRQMEQLAARCTLAIADSHFNERELMAAGYAHTAVVPLLIDMTSTGSPPDAEVTRRLHLAKASGGADLLFVGKVAPHKAPHDLVRMLSVLRRLWDPQARLHLVGSPLGARYAQSLGAFVERLDLGDAVHVTGPVTPAALEAYYRAADVFTCASDHEGFCVPLVEAMGHGVPVVAYGAAAVAETVGHGALVLPTKQPAVFAAAVARVLTDETLRRRLARAAAARGAELSLDRSTAAFVDLLCSAGNC